MRFILLLLPVLLFFSCAEKRFAYRKTLPVAAQQQVTAKKYVAELPGKPSVAVPQRVSLPEKQPDSLWMKAHAAKKMAETDEQSGQLAVVTPRPELTSPAPGPLVAENRALPPGREDVPVTGDTALVLGILSFVLAVLSLLILLLAVAPGFVLMALILAPALGLISLIFGIISLVIPGTGKGFAIAGVAIGSIALVFGLIVWFFVAIILSVRG